MLKRLLIYCFMFTMCTQLFAQEVKTISGMVRDASSGEELVGAIIMEPGTTNGTSTNVDGKFTLTVKANKIVCSYVGYVEQTIIVDKPTAMLDIRLKSDNELDEIVVVGYGVQKKSDLTGSISSVSEKDIRNYAVSNVSELLAGKAAGVFAAASSGQPGDNAVVRIRGFGTVNDNNPLYVVDGQYMDNINSLNPSDIERMEVLKDASAAAIYGSRGSNGVILITTKGGVKGQTLVTFDAYVGVKNSYKALNMMNSDQYYNFIMEAYKDDATFQNSQKEKFTNQYNKGYNTNWWDEVTRNAFTQNYNVSIRKGSDNSRSVISLGYLDDQGAIITTEFKRYSARINQEYDIKDCITLGVNLAIAGTRTRGSESIRSFEFIQKADPFTPVINSLIDPNSENYEYNKYAPTEWSYDPNPVSLLEIPNRYNDKFNVFGNVFANVKLAKGLTYRVQLSMERNQNTYNNFVPVYEATFSSDNLANMESKYNKQTQLTNNTTNVFNYTIENRINYFKEIARHRIDLMGATTYEKNSNSNINAYKTGALGNDEIYQVLDAQTTGDQTSGGKVTTSMMSYLGRLNYTYADKYLLTASLRADGSSRFHKDNRWGCFSSFSLGWRLTEEDFFQALNIENWLSNLKLRVGWGQNGNQRINDNAAHTLIGTNGEALWHFGNGNYIQGYYPSYSGNKNIKWETSQQTNVGFDATLFNNTLDINMDFYIKKTKDMLLEMPIPSFGGLANDPFFNAGDIKNTGFELALNYHNSVGKDFRYNVGVNLSTYKTTVTNLASSEYLTGSVSRTYEGGPIGRFWGHKHIGIFQTQEEIDNYKATDGSVIQPNAKPGDFKFAKLTDSGVLSDDDRTFIGNPNPDLIYGFNLSFNYKDFDLSMALQGTIGNDIWNSSKGSLATVGRQNALTDAYTKAWRQPGDNATYPRLTTSDTNSNFRNSSFYVEDGSYLRLQNIQLGYSIPRKLCEKIQFISSCRFYISGQNLITLTKYTGLDPEVGVNNPLNMGLDNTHYPTSRTVTCGVNIQF